MKRDLRTRPGHRLLAPSFLVIPVYACSGINQLASAPTVCRVSALHFCILRLPVAEASLVTLCVLSIYASG